MTWVELEVVLAEAADEAVKAAGGAAGVEAVESAAGAAAKAAGIEVVEAAGGATGVEAA